MKNFFKKLKQAWKAFNEKPSPVIPFGAAPEPPKPATMEELKKVFQQIEDMNVRDPVALYEQRMAASKIAREVHMKQNDQIDQYVENVLRRCLGDMLYDLYRGDGQPVPYLETQINVFMDQGFFTFGRRIKMFLKGNIVGDAIFRAHLNQGQATLEVEELIPSKTIENTSN